jgi:two-component system, NarL family, sensor kinase
MVNRYLFFKVFIAITVVCFSVNYLTAQESMVIDSLKSRILKEKDDSMRAVLHGSLAFEYRLRSVDSMMTHAKKSLFYAQKLNNDQLLAEGYNSMGVGYQVQGDNETALEWFEKMLNNPYTQKDSTLLSKAHNNLGVTYKNLGQYEKSIDHYLIGLSIDDALNDSGAMALKYLNIAQIYKLMGNYEISLQQDSLALEIFTRLNDTIRLPLVYNNLAITHFFLGNAEQSIAGFKKAYEINLKNGNIPETARNINNIGIVWRNLNDYSRALENSLKALELRKTTGDRFAIAESYMNVASDYALLNDMGMALLYFDSTEVMLNELKRPQFEAEFLLAKATAYERNSQFDKALDFVRKHYQLRDSIVNERNKNHISELMIRFETEKKDRELLDHQLTIAEKEKALKVKNLQASLYLMGFFISLLLLTGGIVIYRQRKKRIEAQFENWQKNKKIENLKFLIAGEEKERTRISRELHDGINGSLAAVKMLIQSHQFSKEEVLEKTSEMIDQISDEVREISHNLMPASLKKFGLITTLNDFLDKIRRGDTLNITLNYFGDFSRLSDHDKLMVYRIVQELVKNVLKHAQATECIVQLTSGEDMVSVTVEDNGKGFISGKGKIESDESGIGLRNVKSRIDMMDGKLDILSDQKSGTSIHIEIPILAHVQ